MAYRNTRPNATRGARSISVSALTLSLRGDTENASSWMIRVFGGVTTTPNEDSRKSGGVCASLHRNIFARPNRASSKISAITLSECDAALRWFEHTKAAPMSVPRTSTCTVAPFSASADNCCTSEIPFRLPTKITLASFTRGTPRDFFMAGMHPYHSPEKTVNTAGPLCPRTSSRNINTHKNPRHTWAPNGFLFGTCELCNSCGRFRASSDRPRPQRGGRVLLLYLSALSVSAQADVPTRDAPIPLPPPPLPKPPPPLPGP